MMMPNGERWLAAWNVKTMQIISYYFIKGNQWFLNWNRRIISLEEILFYYLHLMKTRVADLRVMLFRIRAQHLAN